MNKINIKDQKLLILKNLSLSFGGIKAVSNLSLEVNSNEIFSIIGPNGAGKTTVFNIISGFYQPDAGEVLFDNVNLTKCRPHEIAKLGIGRTFQNLELFSKLTVLENLLVAKHLFIRTNFMGELLKSKKVIKEEDKIRKESLAILQYLNLEESKDIVISNFPFPIQKRIELARALALEPKLLILDEPAGGLNIIETKELSFMIKKIQRDFHITILLVEHDMSMVMNISDRICVLDYGEKIAEGTPEEIQNNAKVIEVYLGKEEIDVRA